MKTIKVNIYRPHELSEPARNKVLKEIKEFRLDFDNSIADCIEVALNNHLKNKFGIIVEGCQFHINENSMDILKSAYISSKSVDSKKFLSQILPHALFNQVEKANRDFSKLTVKCDYNKIRLDDTKMKSLKSYTDEVSEKVHDAIQEFNMHYELKPIAKKIYNEHTSPEALMEWAKSAPDGLLWYMEDGTSVFPDLVK